MAKSIRSKWKRKCRAIKRERYAKKELARLKKMLGIKEDEKTEDEVMESDQVIFLDAGKVKEQTKKSTPEVEDDINMSSDDEKVEIVGEKGSRVFNTKTLKDQNGQYPVWLHKRKIAKMNKVTKKSSKKKSKKRRR